MVRQTIVVQPMNRAAARARTQPNETPSAEVGAKTRQRRPAPEIAPVVRAKIQPPALRPTTLTRERLLERLTDSVGSRVTLVTADAGYGKTTLLADFSRQSGLRTLWYRLEPTDADTITWANYLVAACREVDPDFGQATRNLLRHIPAGEPPKTAFVASFLGELARMTEAPTLLVLDDFHEVDHSAEVRDFVGRLIELAPPWLRLVIAGRRRPAVEFARLAGMGELNEIGLDELRFSTAETERLFTESYGMPLDADVLREVDRRARGWVASLQLFHGSVRGRPASAVRALARSLSGADSPIFDFLAQEVLANVTDEVNEFLVRAALLERVVAGHVVALFADGSGTPSHDQARLWIEEADRLGLITRSSQTSEARQMHPLLRDFLLVQLTRRFDRTQIREMHLRVAEALVDSDPLTACRHYIEAGAEAEAMACLGRSVMLTMGSGQWGVASDLIDRLEKVPAGPAVAAIRARRLIEDGDLVGAERLLMGTDISAAPPDERAVVRHARLSLGWRTGDSELLSRTLGEMQEDPETPPIMRDIAQVFIDASPMSPTPVSYVELARRMERMAGDQVASGFSYFGAVSLHNAGIANYAAGRYAEAERVCNDALVAYDQLLFAPSERYSTHALMASCAYELGKREIGDDHAEQSLLQGSEHADVHVDIAHLAAVTGDRDRAERLLASASSLEHEGHSDIHASSIAAVVRALLDLQSDPKSSLSAVSRVPQERPLDVGVGLTLDFIRSLALFVLGNHEQAGEVAAGARIRASRHHAAPIAARLSIIEALARGDSTALKGALKAACALSRLALVETADGLALRLDMVGNSPEIAESVAAWPNRWLPLLRAAVHDGPSPRANSAAVLLDQFGEIGDVIRLRAYAKTYGTRSRPIAELGKALALRVSPTLQIADLGRVQLHLGVRTVPLSGMRRKAAALLMFLSTRPSFTATREQVLDELWPEHEPHTAANSLNQTLYFLRREVDPWFEDDISVNYIRYEGEVIWLDRALVSVASADFLTGLKANRQSGADPNGVVAHLESYAGQFAPEFEYEEWAIAWRSRVHAAYLQACNRSLDYLVGQSELSRAADIAAVAVEIDPSARDIERKLIWIYWNLGARSSANSVYQHYVREDLADGMDVRSLNELVSGESPVA